jgi:hypothetical protein
MLAERVGVYAFSSPPAAALVYLDRLTRAGVTLMRGDCQRGESGDSAWAPGDALDPGSVSDPIVEYRREWWSTNRSGCFVDEDGTANVRVTCGDGIYIGVLGRDANVSMLYEWTIQYPPGVDPGQDSNPPGICVNSDDFPR